MALMVDRGDSYHVIYLGSCMLSHMSTGLGVLQKPLRELYFRYRQSGGGPAAQERYLRMSARGMAMTYKESASAMPTEVFYSMPSILFWDAVQFCTVRGQDKKLRGAFEPVDNDHSRNKDNLFSVLEKKYHFLQQMTHPPLFTCVLRRTQGVKALDVHAFVCSSDEEALGLVRSLHTVHDHYKSDETVETGVFGYKPFSGAGPTVGGVPDTGGVSVGPQEWTPDGAGVVGGGGGVGQGVMGPGSGGSMPGSLQQPPPRPARPLSLGRRAGGQVQVLPSDGSGSGGRGGQSSRLSSHGLSSSLSSLTSSTSSASSRPQVYQLTQEDFQRHTAGLYLHDDEDDDQLRGERGAGRRQTPHRRRGGGDDGSPDSDDGHHVYQYIRHIDNSPTNTLERRRAAPTPATTTTTAADPGVIWNRNQPPQTSSPTPTHNNNGSIERDTVARSRALVQETLANQHNSISRNLNHLFNQTQVERQAPPPRATVLAAPFTQHQQNQQFHQHHHSSHQRSPPASAPRGFADRGKLGQAYGVHAGGAGDAGGSHPLDPSADERRLAALSQHNPRQYSYGGSAALESSSAAYSNGSVDTESLRAPPRPADRPAALSRSREDVRPRSSASSTHSHSSSQHGSPFTARHATPDAPPRPVAKVPPHKVTGIQVLPPGGAPVVGSLKATKSPEHRKSPFIDTNIGNKQAPPPRRPKSQYFDEPQYMDESSSSGSSPAKSPPPASNWAFGRTGDDSGTGTMAEDRNTGDGTMNEKLLLSKKKDAEIASVLQNLRFDYDGTTMSPGLPAGNNFEKSLGYFP